MGEPREGVSTDGHEETPTGGRGGSDPFADILNELARAPARDPQLSPGKTIGHFVLVRHIDSGGFGVVYEARDTELGRHIAMKFMRTRGDTSDKVSVAVESRFKQEAEAAARLNHPNIVTLHQFGTFDGSPYLVLELLSGQTLHKRLRDGPLQIEEAVAVAIQIAQGLVHAHAAGVIHRDLKPSNVFLGEGGQVKVLDFGLARLKGAVSRAEAVAAAPSEVTKQHIVGTPAYMAPEQWRGEADERTDVYAAGLILFEMLTGRLPWPAADPKVAALAPQAAPPVRGVSDALARIVAEAIDKVPERRPAGAAKLLARLLAEKRTIDNARVVRRVKWAFIAAVPLLLGAGWLGVQMVQRIERDRKIAAHLAEADRAMADARADEPAVDALRRRALAAFDDLDAARGEEGWPEALAAGAAVDKAWAHAGQILERAFILDGSRDDIRRRLGEVLLARALIAERDHRLAQRDELAERLATFGDAEALARWRAPAHLSIDSTPPGAKVTVQRYEGEGPKRLVPAASPGVTPVTDLELPSGSYLILAAASGRPEVRYPVLLGRGDTYRASIPIPSRVPQGFVYVPPGRFLYGCADEGFRASYNAQPEHTVTTPGFFIARHEVTFGDWIEYLEDLPAEQRRQRLPHIDAEARATAALGSEANDLELSPLPGGGWQLTLRGYRVRTGQPFVYLERTRRSSQNWLRFPVTGISFEDGEAYAGWLDRTGRVPRARLCNEHEWERAARGADGRLYPHGDRLDADDADIDVTYGRRKRAYGPDEVGSHPASDSPFDVADLAGNVWELVHSVGAAKEVVERGSSWYQGLFNARSDNREVVEPSFHTSLIGLRLCASPPAE